MKPSAIEKTASVHTGRLEDIIFFMTVLKFSRSSSGTLGGFYAST